MFLYKYHKNSSENIIKDVNIGIFPILIAYRLGFGIFKQYRLEEIPMGLGPFGQSEQLA